MWAIPEEDHYDTADIDCATCRASVASCPEELSRNNGGRERMGGSMKGRSVQPPHGEGHLLCWPVERRFATGHRLRIEAGLTGDQLEVRPCSAASSPQSPWDWRGQNATLASHPNVYSSK
jgi:hypothetical protein